MELGSVKSSLRIDWIKGTAHWEVKDKREYPPKVYLCNSWNEAIILQRKIEPIEEIRVSL